MFCTLITGAAIVFLSACNDKKPLAGDALAARYCGTCHAMVAASLLDKTTWKTSVLPNMAARLGIKFDKTKYVAIPGDHQPALSVEEWKAVAAYYEHAAPERLTPAIRYDSLVRNWSVFRLKKPPAPKTSIAYTTCAAFDSSAGKIYTGDGNTFRLTRWNKDLLPEDSLAMGSPPSNAFFYDDGHGHCHAVFTSLGTMRANDVAEGKVIGVDAAGKLSARMTIAASLPRPVQAVPADINRDGLTDWIVSGFGHNRGGLYWYAGLPGGTFKKNTIIDVPGALQTITGDFNHDGWTDLMELFGAADECIRLFINDRKGGFTQQKVLSFPAVYGSASFQLADFNHDSLPDILYACGDNNDYSPILKPYHGIYIYLNHGNNQYKQEYFFPVDGCTKAVAADFDLDGDLDIASIAFYADLQNNPAGKFIYFEQDRPLHFIPHSPPIEEYGRWICMDVKDYDHDGDQDIILGNFSAPFNTEKPFYSKWDLHLPFIILENGRLGN